MFKKTKFIIFHLKANIIPVIFVLFTICLVLFSNSNLIAAKEGLFLWFNFVVPSLLPFFIATELLSHTNIIYILGIKLTSIMKPLFNVSGEGSFALIMGIISGYPIGAKIVTTFRQNNICSKEECERLLSFTNNSGPLFILGTVGIGLFNNSNIGFILLITHILSCLTVGILFRFWKISSIHNSFNFNRKSNIKSKDVSFLNLGEILSTSITNAINTTLTIGGFIILFSVIISILNQSQCLDFFVNIFKPVFNFIGINSNFVKPFISGLLELTNGIENISHLFNNNNFVVSLIFCAFLLGFGGISILLQVYSIISKSDISIMPYIIGKFLQGLFASFYTYIFLVLFPME